MKTTKMLTILVLIFGLATETVNGDFVFGEPANLGPPVNNSYNQLVPSISSDGLTLYFGQYRPDDGANIWRSTRETKDDPWTEPVKLGKVNSFGGGNGPSISADGLSLYYHSSSNGYGEADIFVTTRETTEDDWGYGVNLRSIVNSSVYDAVPCISSNGLSLYFHSDRPGGYGGSDILVTTRETTEDGWSAPVNLGFPVNTSSRDMGPGISSDGLVLFFVSDRPGGEGGLDLWMTRRATTSDDWVEPVHLGPNINCPAWDGGPKVSADGRTLFYMSQRSGGFGENDIWQVSIDPVVDLNADGIVDSADMCVIVDNWGTDEPLCDIGPMPWGDGIVDVKDLIVLAEHLFEEVPIVVPGE